MEKTVRLMKLVYNRVRNFDLRLINTILLAGIFVALIIILIKMPPPRFTYTDYQIIESKEVDNRYKQKIIDRKDVPVVYVFDGSVKARIDNTVDVNVENRVDVNVENEVDVNVTNNRLKVEEY